MTVRISNLLAAILALAIARPGAAPAATLVPDTGTAVSGAMQLAGRRILLPPGAWRVAGTDFATLDGDIPGPYGAIARVVLTPDAAPAPNPVQAPLLLVQTNVLPITAGWGAPPECQDPETPIREAAESRDRHEACSFVLLSRRRVLAPMLPGIAIERVPPLAMIGGFRASDRQDMVEMRFIVPAPPAGDGPDVPRSQAQALAAWTMQARAAALTALRVPQDQAQPMPAPTLDGTAAAATGDLSTVMLGAYKLVTYRVVSSAATITTASLLAGNLATGIIVAGWQGITHSALWFGNEMAWELPSAPSLMAVTPAAGVAQPVHTTDTAGVVIDGKGVPLPAGGTWQTVASQSDKGLTGTVLARVTDQRLTDLAVVYTNQTARPAIFGSSSDCAAAGNGFAVIRYDTPLDGFCAYGRTGVGTDLAPPDGSLWQAALRKLQAAGVTVPERLAVAGARARTRENVLDIRWYVPDDGATEPGTLAAFADMAQPAMERAVRGRADFQPIDMPSPGQAAAIAAQLAEQTVGSLRMLRAAGILQESEFRTQVALAEQAQAARERQRLSLWTRTAYKVATYRVLSFVDAVGVSWLVTASAGQGFAYAVINAVVQPVLAYGNEILWAGSGVGRAAASLTPVNFPGAGVITD